MKKIPWNIRIIMTCVLTYSIICWFNCGKSLVEEKTVFLSQSKPIDYFFDGLDENWSDKMYQKAFFSKVDLLYSYCMTGEIVSNQVILGKNDWLFYKSAKDSDSIGDYEGTNRYTEVEMREILESTLLLQTNLESKGINFAILVAPNKENIYFEYMPDIYMHEETSSTDILTDFLNKNEIKIISPKEELLVNHKELPLYYSYDTHWNQLGAYIAVKKVLEAWGLDIPSLSEQKIISYDLKDNYHYCATDDLANMIGLRELIFNDEKEYIVDGTGDIDWVEFEEAYINKDVIHYSNSKADVNASILLVGDSFRTAMVPILQEVFSDVYVVHRSHYTKDLLDKVNPQFFLLECVERYSYTLKEVSLLIGES